MRIVVNSQAHFDHVGGVAEVLRQTHAKNVVMDGDVSAVETGAKTDFLTPSPNVPGFAHVHKDRVLQDAETVILGGVTLTAHKPPVIREDVLLGPCVPTCRGSSRNPAQHRHRGWNGLLVGVPFVAISGHPVSYPGIAQDFQHTFMTLRDLPCDIFLGAHGQHFNLVVKLKRYPQEGPRVFINPDGYKMHVADAQHNFERALAEQKASAR